MSNNSENMQSSGSGTRPRRRWFRAIVITTLLVGSGTVFGAVLAVGMMHHSGFHGPGGMNGPDPERMASMLERRLDLSPEQRDQVQAIFSQQQEKLFAIRSETAPRVMEVLDEAQLAVSEVLNPEQAQRWNEHFSRLRSRHMPDDWKQHRRHGGDYDRRRNGAMAAAIAPSDMRSMLPRDTDAPLFRRADANGDGVIDSSEWNRLVSRLLRAEIQREEVAPPADINEESESL